MKCEYCEIAELSRGVLYQDDKVVIALRDNVVTPGQVTIFPKEHFTIFEMVPKEIIERCVSLANKVSISAFETLSSAGTNVIIQNGLGAGQNTPHFGIEVIPRRENDGLQLSWEGKPMPEEEMERVTHLLKEGLNNLDKKKDEPKKEEHTSHEESKQEKHEKKEGKYLLKSLKRIP